MFWGGGGAGHSLHGTGGAAHVGLFGGLQEILTPEQPVPHLFVKIGFSGVQNEIGGQTKGGVGVLGGGGGVTAGFGHSGSTAITTPLNSASFVAISSGVVPFGLATTVPENVSPTCNPSVTLTSMSPAGSLNVVVCNPFFTVVSIAIWSWFGAACTAGTDCITRSADSTRMPDERKRRRKLFILCTRTFPDYRASEPCMTP